MNFLGSCSSPNVVNMNLPLEEKFSLPSLANGKQWTNDNLRPGDEQLQSRKAPVPGRRRSSFKVLMQPTKSVDRGWSWVVCIACFFTTFILIGTLGSFGVLYVGLLEFYSASNDTDICSAKNSSTTVSAQTGDWVT